MSPPPAGPADTARVRQYTDIFAYCLDECAATRAGPHELFLWNARRLGEAMLYALAEGTPWAAQPKPLQGRPMDLAELLRRLSGQGLIPQRLLGNLDTLRHCGNVAPLAQGPDTVAETATLDATRRAVVAVARWFYTESALQEPLPAQVAEALRDLESDQPRTPRHHRTEMELRRLRKALDVATSEPTADASTAPAAAAPRRGGHAAVVAAALAAGALLGWVLKPMDTGAPPHPSRAGNPAQHQGDDSQAPQLLQPLPSIGSPETPAPGLEPAVPKPTPGPAVLAASATPATALPAAALPAAASTAEAPTRSEPDTMQAEPEDKPPLAAGTEPGPGKSPPTDGDCPAGALAIPTRRLDLVQGPTPRPAWPQPTPDPPAQDVERFCIDRSSVNTAAYAEWLATRSPQEHSNHLQPRSNFAPTAQGGLPAKQVSWRQAQAYCLERGGTLPSVLQWEAALRHRTPPALAEALGEWAADSFPPKAFGYTEVAKTSQVMSFKERLGGRPSSRKPLLSWQRGNGRQGSAALTFRCAWPSGSTGEAPR